jgi:HD-GYP domain-containing protein (c-di-GMP phosphodiesterase class II)
MSETRALLGKIVALRQRLEQAQAMAREADSVAASLLAERARRLQEQADVGDEIDARLDGAVRAAEAAAAEGGRPLPRQLTARARRALERGRGLLLRLRPLADSFDPPDDDEARAAARSVDPLAILYRETAAIADTALRTIPLLPESTAAQLHVCEGLEATLNVVEERLAVLTAALERREEERGRVERLAGLLADLEAGRPVTTGPFLAMADDLLADAREGGPLRFVTAETDDPVATTAAHSLTTARVIARVVRHDPDLRHRSRDAVVAALLHDVGMLRVPAEVLAAPGPLADEQRRLVEAHCRHGAELLALLDPEASWLSEAAAAHHERLDGTGYPDGLRAFQLSPLVRLLAVCDVYAALCVGRLYRPARETRTALTDTLLLAEQGKLDRQYAERLLLLSFYPVGSAVELADGTVGVVVATPAGRRDLLNPARPVVTLLLDPDGHPLPAPRHLDLAHCDDHSIVRSLTPEERRDLLGHRFPEWV